MNRIIISKEQLEDVIASSKTKKEAAEKLNISVDTLKLKLKKYNLVFNTSSWKKGQVSPARSHAEITEDWLINNWLNTDKSLKQLSDEFNISLSLLESRAVFYKLKKHLKHKLNTKKLFDLSDPHIWYLAGLANTDGYFPKHFDGLVLELKANDSEYQLLNDIKNYYESSQPVTTYHKHGLDTYYWQISFGGLKEFFKQSFNISTVNKTFDTDVPINFPTESCAKAYLRGCIDGDGYVEKSGHTVIVCTASQSFIDGLAKIVKQYINIDCRLFKAKRLNCEYPAVEWKTRRAEALLRWIYSIDNCFKLERKYQRFINNFNV